MDISIIIPLLNEAESLPELCAWIERVMKENNYSYEIMMIDDGSTDNSWDIICKLRESNANIHGIRFQRNYGKSAALNVGFEAVQGDVVITMDADLQDSPDEIPALYKKISVDAYDLVSGWKKVRYDSKLSKNIPSKFFNWTTRKMSKIKLHDFNCGLKAYRKEVVKNIEIYGEMHRYIPVIAKWEGFHKIGEQVVKHQKRKYGVTKFGLDRFVNGYLDLLTIMFISKFGKQPMHFFGLIGTLSFITGFISFVIVCIQRMCKVIALTNSVWFYISMFFMIIGTILFLSGFLSELLTRNSPYRNHYKIREKI